MASSIDKDKPVEGSPTTASVRANFLAAKTEIEALQGGKAGLASPTFTGTATFDSVSTASVSLGGTAVTATASELNLLAGVTALPVSANNASITFAAGNGLTGGGVIDLNQATNETITFDADSTTAVNDPTITFVAGNNLTGGGSITLNQATNESITFDAASGSTPNNNSISINAGTDMTGGGTFTLNQSFNEGITLSFSRSVGGSLSVSGSITASSNVTAYSDARLKTDVRGIDAPIVKVLQMRGVHYLKDDEPGTGVIAQELQMIAPELVQENEDGYLSVAYGNLTAYLIEAVKELHKELEEFKNGAS